MALLTAKEIAQRIGMAPKQVYTYRTRGVLVVGERGLYDTAHPTNAAFLNKYITKFETKQEIQSILDESTDDDDEPQVAKQPATKKKKDKKEDNKEEDPTEGFALRLLTADLLRKERSAEQAALLLQKTQLELDKKRGEVVPSAAVTPLFQSHNRNIIFEFKNFTDELLRQLASSHDINLEEQAKWRKFLTDGINRALSKSVDSTIAQLDDIISEFSVKRGVGEHD
jgi:hypothetical protein